MNEELAKMNKIIEEKRAIATAKEKAMVAAALEADRIVSVGSDLPKDGKKNILGWNPFVRRGFALSRRHVGTRFKPLVSH